MSENKSSENKDIANRALALKQNDEDAIEAEVTVEPADPADPVVLSARTDAKGREQTITEDVEQIGKDIVVGRKEVHYEDDRNVISVLINAISVRINMPRGTVKLLLACLVALVIVALLFGANVHHSKQAEKAAEKAAAESTEQAEEEAAEQAANSETSPDGVLALKDYVNISPHFYYHLPDNVQEVWTPDELYAMNEQFCDFIYDGDLYTIRSYVLDAGDKDIADTVRADISLFDGVKFVDEEYIDGKYGEILRIRFEALDEEGLPVVVTGYYWYESDPTICCLEVSADKWHDGAAEEMIKDSIYRVSSGSSTPYEVDEDAWNEARKEEAMDGMAEDAAREAYEQKPDESDRVLKP